MSIDENDTEVMEGTLCMLFVTHVLKFQLCIDHSHIVLITAI